MLGGVAGFRLVHLVLRPGAVPIPPHLPLHFGTIINELMLPTRFARMRDVTMGERVVGRSERGVPAIPTPSYGINGRGALPKQASQCRGRHIGMQHEGGWTNPSGCC